MKKQGALQITATLDSLASIIGAKFAELGIPERVARDFESRCDMLSDRIERHAGVDPEDEEAKEDAKKEATAGFFDPSQIGREKAGPLEGDGDEGYMRGEFTRQEYRELREDQQSGKMPRVIDAPRGPRPGIQASYEALTAAYNNSKVSVRKLAEIEQALHLATLVIKGAADDDEDED